MKMTVREKEYGLLPRYLCGATPPWVGHMKFAASLVREFKPQCIVELGTHYGNSYFSFCQAVQFCGLDCKCFAVDHWKGEGQAGNYSNTVFETVHARNEACYKEFSTLLRMDFDEAVQKFADESIDLLHIDGFHSYEAVSHDFKTWEKKVRKGGIILFHDIAVKQEGYGVWKFWEKLVKTSSQTFSFLHSNGLGVWRKKGGGTLESPLLQELLVGKKMLSPDMAAFLSYWIEPPEYKRNTLLQDGHTHIYFTPAELYYAGGDFGFAPDKKLEAEGRSSREDSRIQLEFSLKDIPADTSVFRLDLGLAGELYSIEECCLVGKKGTKINCLPTLCAERSNNVILFSVGENSLEYLALNDDPNLIFTPPAGKYSSLELCVCRNKSGAYERLRSDLIAKLTALQQIQVQLQQDLDTWKASSQAFEQDRDAWKASSQAFEQDRDAWKDAAEKSRESQKELAGQLQAATAKYDSGLKEKEEELSRSHSVISEQKTLIAQWGAAVKEKESALQGKNEELAHAAALLTDRENIISRRDAIIEEREKEIQQRSITITEQAAVISERESAIRNREEELESQRILISNQQAALTQKDTIILEKENEIQKQNALLTDRENIISRRDAAIEERENEIASQRTLISNQQAGIVQRDAAILKRDEEIARRSAVIAERENIISLRNVTLQEKEEEIGRLGTVIAERENTISNKDTLILEREKEIARQRQLISERENTISNKDTLILEREKEIARQKELIRERENIISCKESVILEREKEIARQKELIRERENIISCKESVILERDTALARREEELASQRAFISNQQAALTERDRALQEKEAETVRARDVILCQDATLRDDLKELISRQKRLEEQENELRKRAEIIEDLEERVALHQGEAENLHLLLSFREKELESIHSTRLWRWSDAVRKIFKKIRK